MAHLKKFSLAKKLQKLQDNTLQVLTPLLFAQGNDDCLFYSADSVTQITQKRRKLYRNLQYTMKILEIPYLSANQVGLEERVFSMQIQNRDYKWSLLGEKSNCQNILCINPSILQISEFTNVDWETNVCLPFLRCQIERYDKIKIHFQGLEEENEIEFEGFNARVVQQAIDSLNGYQIIDPRIHRGKWEINPKWKNVLPKTELTIEFYKNEIEKLVKSNPECFAIRNLRSLNRQFKEDDDEFSFESIMMKRFEKYIKREMLEPAAANFDGVVKEDVLNKLKK